MRFLHLGDLHLGKSLGDFDLIGDQKYILDQMLAVIRIIFCVAWQKQE